MTDYGYRYMVEVDDGTSTPNDFIRFNAPDGNTAVAEASALAEQRGVTLVRVWAEVDRD